MRISDNFLRFPNQVNRKDTPVKLRFIADDRAPSSGVKYDPKQEWSFSDEGINNKATCQAIDYAGNKSEKVEVTVKIDKTEPDLPSGNNFYIYSSPALASADDIKAALDNAITDKGGSGLVTPITYGNLPAPGTLVQQVTVTITAVDNAGNSATKSITVKVLLPRGR